MNESTALAQRLAIQLGDDVDRILGQPTNTGDVYVDTRHDTGVELRQIAGLTAGATMRLSDGSYQFGQSESNHRGLNEGQPAQVGFALTVKENETWIEAGAVDVTLNGEAIDGPTKVGDAVIEVGSARFLVARPRRPVRRRQTNNDEFIPAERLIEVPDLADLSSSQSGRGRSSLLSVLRGHSQSDPAAELLTQLVRAQREEVIGQRRASHPHPEEIVYRARNARSVAWDRPIDHPKFGQVPVAFADIAWRPQFDRPDRVPTSASDAFAHLQTLPSVPIVADLRVGPLGIIGSRASVLSVARNVMLTLATVSSPDDLTIAVLADEARASQWSWADTLPHNIPEGAQAFPILVVDGLHHASDPALEGALASTGEFGCILLGDDIEELPSVCSTVVLIDDGGTATVIDNRTGATTMGSTPLGLSLDLASVAVNSLRSLAVGAT